MKTTKIAALSLALTVLGLGGVVSPKTMTAAFAQDGQDQQAPPPPMDQGPPPPMDQGPGGPGGFGGPGGPNGMMGGQGRFGRPNQNAMLGGGRFAFGTVSAVDPAAKTITLASAFSGTQTIQVSDTTQITTQITVTIADLKVGDHVQVQGVPTGITASVLTIGENPLAAGVGGGRQSAAPGQGGPGGFGAGRPGGTGAQQSSAMAVGTIASTSPLTVTLSSSATLTLKMDSSAKVTKYSPVALSGIKVGDHIVSTGQAGDNGVFAAATVGVNMQTGGGFGGPGGPGGFGGPGGQGRFGRPGQGGPMPTDPSQ